LPDLRRLKDDHRVVERWAKLEQAGKGDEWALGDFIRRLDLIS
jgi:hypothetical protein